MQFNFFIPKLTFTNTSIMNFVSQKFRDSAVMSQMFVSKSWIWEVSHSIPASFLTWFSYLFFPPATPQKSSSPIYLPDGSTLGQHYPIFLFLPPRFLTHETSGSKPCDLWCHELAIQSQNHTMVILTIILRATPRNACLYLQIHLCNTKLKLAN